LIIITYVYYFEKIVSNIFLGKIMPKLIHHYLITWLCMAQGHQGMCLSPRPI